MTEPGGDRDLAREPVGAERGRELGAEKLYGNFAVVSQIVGEIDRRHSAFGDLALDGVSAGEDDVEFIEGLMRHRARVSSG